ncbi:hypothetical protein [Candidatus Endoriftia persephone]|jgi:hypothetical protein|uniref:Uncharacterized protein n=3 Tax=Gammaproteobacteria TaxID=1236 RepID=G2FEV2_9GAMM|nr:hypothetical protein [Candidatus Endoriftia persephone]EGV49891.1 hypothetical protein Rifp1Sym_fh00020 [endosymbiont of Riftia pachyptila (vent Ph05)]EGW54684.1 hypothetical protein TevJSym_aj00490 [endosymbiont of Tevnia jerichonana (vent Tica)]USF88435.1 hypothetical protein L0Y14_04140 [Candidatus Endoriftia persephone]
MKMTRNKTLVVASLAAALFSSSLPAEERPLQVDSQGFCSSLPSVDRVELSQHILKLHNNLQHQQAELTRAEIEKRFDSTDAVITIILPGGLLYAAYRKADHLKTKARLEQVSSDLNRLSVDLVAFNPIGSIQVAQAH